VPTGRKELPVNRLVFPPQAHWALLCNDAPVLGYAG